MPTKLIANFYLVRSRSSANSFTSHKNLSLFKLIMLVHVVVALPTHKLTNSLPLQAGDVEQHPGPYKPKFPCMICDKAAKWNQKCLQCNLCSKWYHSDCINMSSSMYYEHVDTHHYPGIAAMAAECPNSGSLAQPYSKTTRIRL